MKLERYLQKTIVLHLCVVALSITFVLSLFDFVKELRHVNQVYQIHHVFFYQLMHVPYRLYLLFPIECLVATVSGCAYLISTREFLAMRLLGISTLRFMRSLIILGLCLASFLTILGEYVIPKLEVYAEIYRQQVQGNVSSSVGTQGLWLKEGNDYIRIGYLGTNGQLSDFYQYRFDNNKHLKELIRSDGGTFNQNYWLLSHGEKVMFTEQGVKNVTFKQMPWQVDLSPGLSKALNLKPEKQSMRGLLNGIDLLSNAGQSTRLYTTYLLEKLFKPVLLIIMLFFGFVTAFMPVRSDSLKLKTFIILIVGFLFFILNSVSIKIGLLYEAPVWIGPSIPLLVALLLSFILLIRAR